MADERQYVTGLEQDRVSRAVLTWLDQYPDKPTAHIEFEFLGNDSGMSLSTVTAAYKTEEYITGAYNAQYQFAILYRVSPQTSGDRLRAAEILDTLGRWAEERKDLPQLGAGMTATQMERNSIGSLVARYDDKTEDYQLLMTMNYEVKNNG